jgi:hypothetical protein
MAFYEVITTNTYDNEVLQLTFLIICAHCVSSRSGSNRPQKKGCSLITWAETSIIRFKSSGIVLGFTAQHTTCVNKYSSSKALGQATSVATQTNHAAHFNCFENVDWEMQLPADQNKRVHTQNNFNAWIYLFYAVPSVALKCSRPRNDCLSGIRLLDLCD